MKLSSYRRLLEQDYPDNTDLIKKLGITLNSSFGELYNALNNNLTLRENFSATVQDFTVTVDVTGTPKNKTSFKLSNGQTNVEGLSVINALASDPTVYPTSGIFVSFTKSESSIIVQKIKGLPSDQSFTIRVIVYG